MQHKNKRAMQMKLQKSVSTFTLLSSAVAGIIGSGWLLGPLMTAKMAGPAAILSWVIGGILMMVVASTFAILTRALPATGGTVRFFQLTHGHFAGFGFSWIAWLAWVAVPPIEMLAIIQYSTNYWPNLMTDAGAPVLTSTGLIVATTGLFFIAVINSSGFKTYALLNHIVLAFKLIIPISATVLLLSTHFHFQNFFGTQGFMPYGIKSVFTALPLAGVIYSFVGFNPAVELAAESKNPNQLPFAILGSLFICMIIYVLVQVGFIAALPADIFARGWSNARFVGDAGSFAGLLTILGFVWFVKILYVDAVVSPYGTALAQSISTSRIAYGMSQNAYFPAYFKHVNQHGTPVRAIILNTLIGFLFFLPFPSWQHMVGFLVSCLVLGYVVGPMALMVLAREKPALFKPLSQKLIQTICCIAFMICNLLIYWSGWSIVFKIMILFAIGYMILGITVLTRQGFAARDSLHFKKGVWVLPYLLGMAVISYCGSFGGTHKISFGVDFLVVAFFSVCIYIFAYHVSGKN